MNVLLNEDPDFVNTARSDFRIGLGSAAIDIGDQNIANTVPLDILGIDRTTDPDLGSYEFTLEE